MRVLVTTTGSAGHLGPLIPFADAVRDAGGEVLVATGDSTAAQVRAAGYEVRPFGEVLSDDRDTHVAATVAEEVRTLPTVDVAAGIIRDLAAQRRWPESMVRSPA